MGTRGAYGFRIDEKDKVTSNGHDSHPSGLGKNIMIYIANTPLEKIRVAASRITLVRGDSEPSAELIKRYKKYAEEDVSENWNYYDLLAKTQRNRFPGNLFFYNKDLEHMIDDSEFLHDSLFCEWAYIINMDSGQFEVYQGGNEDKSALGRYARYKVPDNEDHMGVVLVKETPLVDITKDRVDDLAQMLQEQEDEY